MAPPGQLLRIAAMADRIQARALTDVIPSGRSFLVHHGLGSRWSYLVHAHPCYELIHVAGNGCDAVVGDHHGRFRAGEAILLAPGLPHSFYTDGFLPDGRRIAMHLVYFSADLVDAGRVPELRDLGSLLARSRRGLRFAGVAADQVGGWLADARVIGDAAAAAVLVLRCLARLAQAEGEPLAEHESSSRFRGEDMARLDVVRTLILRRFREPLTLDEIAAEARMSASTLNHLLKTFHKTTFLRYLTSVRMDEARRLLSQTDADVTEVALSSGFGSIATFNRRFRAAERMPPHAYRARQLRAGDPDVRAEPAPYALPANP